MEWEREKERERRGKGNAVEMRDLFRRDRRSALLRFLLIEFRLSDRFDNNDNNERGKEKGRGNLETSVSGERLINWFFVAN